MKKRIVLPLLGLLLLPLCAAQLAAQGEAVPGFLKPEIGLSYSYKLAKISNLSSSTFGLQGAALEGVFWLPSTSRHLGLAIEASGETASAIQNNVDLNEFTLVAGPRYGWKTHSPLRVYGQALLGFSQAFGTVLPTRSGLRSSASSFALHAGGGCELPLNKKWGLRLFDVEYEMTRFANNADSYQGNVRFSSGVTYRF